MGWKYRTFLPGMICIIIITNMISVKFSTAQDIPFVVGLSENPPKLDPQEQFDLLSNKVINQVCEGLYRYNYSSPEMEPIPQLASTLGIWDGNNLTINLRENVKFHNGDPFNASAVKWTFDRIQYFTSGIWENGELIAKSVEIMASRSYFYHNGTPILNTTIIEGELIVRFVVNIAPGFFEALLAFMGTQIMLPDPGYSRGEKFSAFLNLNDNLIGTGPFELVEYELDNHVVFKAFEDYYLPWRENHIKSMYYLIVPNDVTRSLAILNDEIHWGKIIADFGDDFALDPRFVEIDVKRWVCYFIQMNIENIPQEVRKASAFAYNYSYLHEDRFGNRSLYLHTPVPNGMLYHHEGFIDEPYTNLTYARELILSCPELTLNITATGLTISNSSEEWHLTADSSTPLAWYNFTAFYPGLDYHYNQLKANMKDIGIRIDFVPPIPWGCWDCEDQYWFLDKENHHRLCYSFGGWGPNLNDPIDMIENLYGSYGSANFFMLNDSTLDQMIFESYNATISSTPTREEVFQDMQEYIVTEIVPSFYIYQLQVSIMFNREYVEEDTVEDLKNPMGYFYWFNVGFSPPAQSCCPSILVFLFSLMFSISLIGIGALIVIVINRRLNIQG